MAMESLPATCFPTVVPGFYLGRGPDPQDVGEALAEECIAHNVTRSWGRVPT
ncbi:MAG: hypothetical protein R2873_29580 [Caldilineaceae bacterium]